MGRTACAPPNARACPLPVDPASAGAHMHRTHRGGRSLTSQRQHLARARQVAPQHCMRMPGSSRLTRTAVK